MKKILGILSLLAGGYTAFSTWPGNIALSIVLGVVTLSFTIESFKRRKFQVYDYAAMLIIFGSFVYYLLAGLI